MKLAGYRVASMANYYAQCIVEGIEAQSHRTLTEADFEAMDEVLVQQLEHLIHEAAAACSATDDD